MLEVRVYDIDSRIEIGLEKPTDTEMEFFRSFDSKIMEKILAKKLPEAKSATPPQETD